MKLLGNLYLSKQVNLILAIHRKYYSVHWGITPPTDPQWTPIILRFFILNPILSFKKVTKFLFTICHFKFLVMTEKNIFVSKIFLSLNISDFSYFLCKNCNLPLPPLKKVTPPPLSKQPPLKTEIMCQAPCFENFVKGSTPPSRPPPPAEKGGGCSLWVFNTSDISRFHKTFEHP